MRRLSVIATGLLVIGSTVFGCAQMSGSDAGSMKSRAVRDGDNYLINGRKSWVTSAPVADYILLFTMTAPEKKHHGITAFMIDTKLPGFSRGKKEPKLGIRFLGQTSDESVYLLIAFMGAQLLHRHWQRHRQQCKFQERRSDE